MLALLLLDLSGLCQFVLVFRRLDDSDSRTVIEPKVERVPSGL